MKSINASSWVLLFSSDDGPYWKVPKLDVVSFVVYLVKYGVTSWGRLCFKNVVTRAIPFSLFIVHGYPAVVATLPRIMMRAKNEAIGSDTIHKKTRSLLFYCAKPNKSCLSFTTKPRVCVWACICVFVIRLTAGFAGWEALNQSRTATTGH